MWRWIAILSILSLTSIPIAAQEVSCVEFWQSAIDKAGKDSPQLEYLNAQLAACEESPVTQTPTPDPTATPRPTATKIPPKIIAEGTITGDIDVNVRTCASTSCQSVAKISPGETVHIIAESDGWYEVQLEPGGNPYFIASFLIKPDYCASNISVSGETRGSFWRPHEFCSLALVDGDLLMGVTGFEFIEGNVWRGRWYYSPATGYQFLRVKVTLWCDRVADDVCDTGSGYKYSVVGDGWASEYESNVNDYLDFGTLAPGGGGYIEMIFHVKQGERNLMLRYDPISYGYDVQFFSIFPDEMF